MEWSGNVLEYGKGYFWQCAKIFGTMRLFREKKLSFLPGSPRGKLLRRGLVMTPAIKFLTNCNVKR